MKASQNAAEILREEHKQMEKLFNQYEEAKDPGAMELIMDNLSLTLHMHRHLEEQVLYPAVEGKLEDTTVVEQSKRGHEQIELILNQLQRLIADADQNDFEQKVQELRESVRQHIDQEENTLIPTVEKLSDVDLQQIGEQLLNKKEELTTPPPEGIEAERAGSIEPIVPRSRLQPQEEFGQ